MRLTFFAVLLVAVVLAVSGAHALTDIEATYQFFVSLTNLATGTRAPTQDEIANCLNNNIGVMFFFDCLNRKVEIDLDFTPGTIVLPEVPSGATGSQIQVYDIELDCAGDNTVCSSQFPASWVTLSNLQQLSTDFQLSGTLPADWTQMTSLYKLELGDGSLTGPLPAMPSSIGHLDLARNNFCGMLPDSWYSLSLTSFKLESTDTSSLCGCTPSWTYNYQLRDELQDLGFDKNTGCSTVNPTCDGTCGTTAGGGGSTGGGGSGSNAGATQDEIDATYQFVAAIAAVATSYRAPTRDEIANCLNNNIGVMFVFDCLNYNVEVDVDFTPGNFVLPEVPSGFSGSQVRVFEIELDCEGDHMNCHSKFPESWVTLSKLQRLSIDFQLSGTLPADWTQMTSLYKLELTDGSLTGSFPTLPSSLRDIDLGKNSFCGTLPDSWASLPLSDFDMEVWDTRNLCGCTPSWANNRELRDELQDLGFDKNTGCSTVNPNCDGTCNVYDGGNTGGGGNTGSNAGATADEIDATYQFVAAITQVATGRRAPTRDEIANCLNNNVGVIYVFKCENYNVKVDLDFAPGDIVLPGVPTGFSGSQVRVYDIELDCANDRKGCRSRFPASWVTLSNLQELSFDDFELTSTLPCDWTKMTSLYKLELSDGSLTGSLPTLPSSMRDLDMGKNRFCGTLPDSWASLPLTDFDMEVYDRSKLCGCTASWANNKELRDELQDLGFNKNTGCSTVSRSCDNSCAACGTDATDNGNGAVQTPVVLALAGAIAVVAFSFL